MGSGGYVLCEYGSVKSEFPEFASILSTLHESLIRKAEEDWKPLTFDRNSPMAPGNKMFGESTIIPSLFLGQQLQRLVTWDQWFNATGHQPIMWGAGIGGTIGEDFKVGLAGLAFLSKAIRIAEIRMQITDRKIPRINIEEAFAYENPAIIFEQPFILDEKTGYELMALVLSQGPQRIMPIGFQLNRVRDKMLTNTGSALPLT